MINNLQTGQCGEKERALPTCVKVHVRVAYMATQCYVAEMMANYNNTYCCERQLCTGERPETK